METHKLVVEKLKKLMDANPEMKSDLDRSLQKAVEISKNGDPENNIEPLNPELYKAIDKELGWKGWPTSAEAYYEYLDNYVRLIPNEIRDPEYPNAWTSDGTKNGYNQKVYDLLCQSYWLIDQNLTEDPNNIKTMQSYPEFADWLVDFAKAWGAFLDTKKSLTPATLASFEKDSMYNMGWYNGNKSTWTTFNQFFYREFNGADPETGLSPLRPISCPKDNSNVVSPADCTFKACYPIVDGNVMSPDGERLKHTHSIGTVDELLTGDNMDEKTKKRVLEYAKDFYGGTFIHYFLSPFDYHRFHTPIAGKVLEITPIDGQVYLNVVSGGGQFHAPDNSESDDTKVGYEFTQARGLIILDGGDKVGKVVVLPIGMCQVSGVMMYDGSDSSLPNISNKNVVKGQEFGKFRFGGSDIIMLFEKPPKDLYMFQNDPSHNPIHFQYGQTSVYVK
ncbi:phosphatidylserine decarboxylase [Pseudotenacibaculum sp. MALMAid0570]|mgnify:CR=1 FL=1|uniref:phosphatidylserine decarboxylase n=1 Tax=Pseudotenacibaculum sp. MALMAid0570 TaxID=3143938 RepID=UPI0032DF466A